MFDKTIALTGAVLLGASVAPRVGAAERFVDRDGRADFGAAPFASDDTVFVDAGAASVTKSGTDAWTLPLGNFFAFGSGFEFSVLGGELSLTAGTAPDFVSTPPSVLNDAAVWLVAGKNVATNASGTVIGWYDARESSATAVNYGYAEAPAAVLAGAEGVVETPKNDRKAIAFRAYHSSSTARSLELRTAAGAAATYNMYDGFYVMTPRGPAVGENVHAPVLGSTANGYFFSGNRGTGAMLSEDGNAEWKAYACTYRHNGAVTEPTEAIDGDACHVCSFSVYNSLTIPIDSIMRDRNYSSGGLYLHEVLVFTRRLTPLERARVTAYLMQKWQVETGTVTINGTEDTVVRVGDCSTEKLNVTGGASLSPTGASLAPALTYAARDRAKRFRLEADGGRLDTQGTEFSLKLADGDNLTIDDSLSTNRAVVNAAGKAGEISISGARRATVIDQAPASKLKVTSAAGDIVLRARTAATSSYVSVGGAEATLSATGLAVPAGTGGATASVTIPTAGDWEVEFDIQNAVEFKTGSAWTDGAKACYRVTLVDHTDLLDKVALAVKPSLIGGVIPHRRYLIRNIPAGTYAFKIAGAASAAAAATVENLAFTYVPNPARETIVPVTEGDFESMTMQKAYFSSRDNLNSTYTQWKIANGPAITSNPLVQSIVNSMMGVAVTSGGYEFQFRAHELGRYGDNALMWIHTNSTASAVRNTATSPATVLPAGTWKLRMKACRMTTGPTEFSTRVSSNPNGVGARCGKALAKYQAKVRVNGGAAVDLGVTDEIDTFAGKTYAFPNTFTVTEGASVVIDLDQLVGWSFSLTDDYEFVKVGGDETAASDAGLGPELIVDGSFENSSGGQNWTRESYNDGVEHRADVIGLPQNAFGKTRCDGFWVVRAFNAAKCYQPVALEKGVYRLSYWSRARCDSAYGNGLPNWACHLHFWAVPEGSTTTNRIVTGDTLWSTNFYETTALFAVETAGTYLLGFNTDPTTPGTTTESLVDCVSVRKVLGTAGVPGIDPAAELVLRPANGTVRLDYPGTLTVKSLRVGGRKFYGEVTSATDPTRFSGPGRILVTDGPKGGLIIVR